MNRLKSRSVVACRLCHKQKLKCTGDLPCRRCASRGKQCTYPTKDRIVTVAESYLKSLEHELMLYRNGEHVPQSAKLLSHPQPQPRVGTSDDVFVSESRHDLKGTSSKNILDDCSSENFVQKLREMSLATVAPKPQEPFSDTHRVNLLSSSMAATNYTYSRLKIDVVGELSNPSLICMVSDEEEPEVTLRLPPRMYALYLLDVFEEGFCDYHFILRKQFRQRLLLTYQDPRSQARDRIWLCRLSVVMALAEAWNSGRKEGESGSIQPPQPPSNCKRISFPEGKEAPSTDLPPGAELFEQGLYLFRSPLEEANIEHIEALNLIAFYCYSLNRRRTAYLTAGQSVRTATLLRLHEPWIGEILNNEVVETDTVGIEHRKRVWWTSYCMDRMVSNEFGFPPAQTLFDLGIALPSNNLLGTAAGEEFFNADILTAHIRLCRIRTTIVEGVSRKTVSANLPPEDIDFFIGCMERLHEWFEALPAYMSFRFADGIPDELWKISPGRAILSLYLRYHQCMVLILRPLLLQDISQRPSQQGDTESTSSAAGKLLSVKTKCLDAAFFNCKILDSLRAHGKIAKFGYWDSVHLFSSLAMLCLAKILHIPNDEKVEDLGDPPRAEQPQFNINKGTTFTAAQTVDSSREVDRNCLYADARALLEDMAQLGNPAAGDHVVMLRDVEDVVSRVYLQRNSAGTLQHIAESTDFSTHGDTGFEGVPFLDGTDFSFGGLQEDQAMHSVDWDSILNGISFD